MLQVSFTPPFILSAFEIFGVARLVFADCAETTGAFVSTALAVNGTAVAVPTIIIAESNNGIILFAFIIMPPKKYVLMILASVTKFYIFNYD